MRNFFLGRTFIPLVYAKYQATLLAYTGAVLITQDQRAAAVPTEDTVGQYRCIVIGLGTICSFFTTDLFAFLGCTIIHA